MNFQLIQHHKYSLTDIENLIPWEREIYVSMLLQWLEDERIKERQQAANNKY
jgi:hypothetical protein